MSDPSCCALCHPWCRVADPSCCATVPSCCERSFSNMCVFSCSSVPACYQSFPQAGTIDSLFGKQKQKEEAAKKAKKAAKKAKRAAMTEEEVAAKKAKKAEKKAKKAAKEAKKAAKKEKNAKKRKDPQEGSGKKQKKAKTGAQVGLCVLRCSCSGVLRSCSGA